jgi:hypothetical protein
MKRSEMIRIIDQELGYDTDPESVLDAIEKSGMVPPEVKEPCETLYLDHTGRVVKGEDSFVFVHKWETEDE